MPITLRRWRRAAATMDRPASGRIITPIITGLSCSIPTATISKPSATRTSSMTAKRIFTIGYEGATQSELIAALQQAGVERLIDVRAVPLSRKPGFSKNVLATGLREAGIDYVHLKALGTPPAGREAARKGRWAEMNRIYAEQLETPEAGAEAGRMIALAEEKPSALLCFERDPAHCHRTPLRMAVLPDWETVDLYA